VREQLEAAQSELATAQSQLAAAEAELATMRAETAALREEVAAASAAAGVGAADQTQAEKERQEQIVAKQEEIDTIKQQLAAAEEQSRTAQANLDKSSAEHQQALSSLQSELDTLREEVTALRATAAASAASSSSTASGDGGVDEVASLSLEVESLRAGRALADLEAKVTAQGETIAKYKLVVQKLHDKIKAQGEKMNKAKEAIAQLTEQLEEAKAAHATEMRSALEPCVELVRPHMDSAVADSASLSEQLQQGVQALLSTLSSVKAENLAYLQRQSELEHDLSEAASKDAGSQKQLQQIAALEEDLRAAREQLAAAQVRVTQSEEKHAQMKALLLRANKHIDRSKSKMAAQNADVHAWATRVKASRKRMAKDGWPSRWALEEMKLLQQQLTESSAPKLTTDASTPASSPTASSTDGGSNDAAPLSLESLLGSPDLEGEVDVARCRVEKRVCSGGEGADATYWCLVALPLEAPAQTQTADAGSDDAATTASAPNSSDVPAASTSSAAAAAPASTAAPAAASVYRFWVRQEQWVTKRMELRARKAQEVQQVLRGTFAASPSNAANGTSAAESATAAPSIDSVSLVAELSRCATTDAVVLFDQSVLPACVDADIRASLTASFERKLAANAASFERSLQECQAKLDASAVELAATKSDYARYKSRAQSVLAQQQQEVSSATAALEAMKTQIAEVESLRAQVERMEQEKAAFHPQRFQLMQQQLTGAQEALAAQRELQREGEARLAARVSELEAQLVAAASERAAALSERDEELRQARLQAKEELERHRQKARELATQQEAQIHVLQSKLKGLHLTSAAAKEEALQPHQPPTPTAAAATTTAAEADGSVTSGGKDTAADASSSSQPLSNDAHLSAALSASRDEELSRCRTHIRQLQDLLRTSELSSAALRDRESALQRQLGEAIRAAQRASELAKQDNLEYMKNVLLRFLETGDESLITVLATLMHLSKEEVQEVKQKRASNRSGIFGLFG